MPAELLFPHEEEKPGHECGIGLIYSFETHNLQFDVFKVGHALQHRGQNGAGIATDSGFRITGSGLLKDAIPQEDLRAEDCNHWAMVHLRYGTSGGYGSENMQPVEVMIEGQKVHVAVNGNIPNVRRLSQYTGNWFPEGISDTVLAAHTLASISGDTMDQKIKQFAELLEIAASANNMLIGIGESVYVMRDQFGLHPLVMGDYHQGKGIVIASETAALQKIGSSVLGEFPPGGIMKLSPGGLSILQSGSSQEIHQQCIFEPAYFSSPNSRFRTKEGMHPKDWLSVMQFRMQTGQIVARENPVSNADFVVGMPDSGVPFSTGLATGLAKPYYPSVIRSHYNGEEEITRTFMQDHQINGIAALVKGKLMPVDDPRIWRDKVVVIGDDSLVRGNTAKEVTKMIRHLGAREIHWRYGFPPVQWPCHLGVSFRSREELLAAQMDNDWDAIAQYIGADSVAFISNEGILHAARECSAEHLIHPDDSKEIYAANGYCGGCTTGVYPIMPEGTIYQSTKKHLH